MFVLTSLDEYPHDVLRLECDLCLNLMLVVVNFAKKNDANE